MMKQQHTMKTFFNFRFDTDLKKQVEKFAQSQKPKESVTHIIHKALYEYLDKHKK